MMKHLFWIPWVFAALVLGILFCIGMMVYLLFFQQNPATYHPGAILVKEAFRYAAMV